MTTPAKGLTPEVLAIHQWIRDDAPVSIKMIITSEMISALAARLNAARAEEREKVPDIVVRLVIAAREVAFGPHPAAAIDALDKASEAFADRVPWEDEPEAAPKPAADGEG